MSQVVQNFNTALYQAGLPHTGDIIANTNEFQRFGLPEDKGSNPCFYKLNIQANGSAFGIFGCWKRNIKQSWHGNNEKPLTNQQKQAIEEITNQEMKERKSYHQERVKAAQSLWENAPPATANHPYLLKKQVQPHGLKTCQNFNGKDGDFLLIPINDIHGKLISLQSILPDGTKRFFAGASTKGVFVFGDLNHAIQAYLCEGFATGATIHELTNHPVAGCFSCHNLQKMVALFKQKYPDIKWIVAADNDVKTKEKTGKNPGIETAQLISRDLEIPYVFPKFEESHQGSDVNDLYCLYGKEAVYKTLNNTQKELPQDVNEKIKKVYISDEKGNQKRRSQVDILEDIGRCCRYIIDSMGDVYAVIWENKARKIYPLYGEDFADWLNYKHYSLIQKGINNNSLRNALDTLRAYAKHRPQKANVFLRFGRYQENTYIDLCNGKWQAIEISKIGCRVINNAPIYFVRTPAMKELDVDLSAKPQDFLEIFDIINVPEQQQALFLCWLLAAIKGCSPYAVLNIYGSADSGKTTLTKAARDLIDPSAATTRKFPKDERNLIATLKNNAVLAFDNTSIVSPELSDDLARLTFGKDAGISQRQLYTDDREKIYNRQAPVIINSISDAVIRPDLQNRCLDITPEPIGQLTNQSSLSEANWEKQFHNIAPKVRGALCHMLSMGMVELAKVPYTTKGRLRELIKLSTAVERATGIYAEGTTQQQYDHMRENSIMQLADSIPLTQFILEQMQPRLIGEAWCIATKKFVREYNQWLQQQGERQTGARNIGRQLVAHHKNLYELGIDCQSKRSNGKRFYRFVKCNNKIQEFHGTNGTEEGNYLKNKKKNSAITCKANNTQTALLDAINDTNGTNDTRNGTNDTRNDTAQLPDYTEENTNSAVSAKKIPKKNILSKLGNFIEFGRV